MRRYFILLCLFGSLAAGGASARADQLHLRNGRVVEADEVWEMGEELWFRQGKVIASVTKAEVLRVVRPRAERAPKAASHQPDVADAAGVAGGERNASPSATRTVARVVLKSGVRIEADSVWEDKDRVGYRLGNMQTFIEREAVARILREVVSDNQPSGPRASGRFTTGHAGLDQLIADSAAKYAVDPLLIYLVMREESGFNYRAVSHAGARGLMQLMPATARRLGVRNIHDPGENVEAGTRYLKNLIELFAGDVNLALAAYNAGEGAVVRYGYRVPPYRETQSYVRRINAAYRRAGGGAEAAAVSK